eukprot:7839765-Pyramimonas_sp.AAC.1
MQSVAALAERGTRARNVVSVQKLRNVITWAPDEEREFQGLQGRAPIDEQKRLLHNREARQQGYHVLGPLTGARRDQDPH